MCNILSKVFDNVTVLIYQQKLNDLQIYKSKYEAKFLVALNQILDL